LAGGANPCHRNPRSPAHARSKSLPRALGQATLKSLISEISPCKEILASDMGPLAFALEGRSLSPTILTPPGSSMGRIAHKARQHILDTGSRAYLISQLLSGPVPHGPLPCEEPFLTDEESAHAPSTRRYSDSWILVRRFNQSFWRVSVAQNLSSTEDWEPDPSGK
jgi:hypothetical protein